MQTMPDARRVPRVRLPRTDRPLREGVALAALVHGGFILLLLFAGERLADYARGLGFGPGDPGGGGGGAGTEIRLIDLPALGAQERAARQPAPPEPELTAQPAPFVPELETVADEPRLEVAAAALAVEGDSVQPAGSGGPGAGPGAGGGVGAGEGTGVGVAAGPGTGGDGGIARAPEPRVITFPYDAPKSVKGRAYTLRFRVDAEGRVVSIAIDPSIDDAGFRKRLLDRLYAWTFYPARTLAGTPVSGELTFTYNP